MKNYIMFTEQSSKEKNVTFYFAYSHDVLKASFLVIIIFFKFWQLICAFHNTCPFQCCLIVFLSPLLECRDDYWFNLGASMVSV